MEGSGICPPGGRRVVAVTGAASGIGRATARRCSSEGFAVGLLDRDVAALDSALDLVGGGPGPVRAVPADVTAPSEVRSAVAELVGTFGRLDAVVNAAGIGGYTGDVVETSMEQWDRVLAVDLRGVFVVSRAAVPHLRVGGGRIVNVSSQYGLVGGAGSPAYAAAKAGVIGLTRAMAVDHAGEGILVNCVCPGPTDTPMLRASRRSPAPRAQQESVRTAHRPLLAAPGRPEDVAGVITFLLGPDASQLTGAVIAADGGWTAS